MRTLPAPEEKGKCFSSHLRYISNLVNKCDGEQPCSGCKSSSIPCVYVSRDRRLREHRGAPEIMDDLQARKHILDQIWQKLSSGQGQDLLNQIQAGTAFDDVAKQLAGPDVAAKLLSVDPSPTLNVSPSSEPQHPGMPLESKAGGDQPQAGRANLGSDPSALGTQQYQPELEDKDSGVAQENVDPMSDAPQSLPDRSTWHPSLQIRWQKNEIVVGSKCSLLPRTGPVDVNLGVDSGSEDVESFAQANVQQEEDFTPQRPSFSSFLRSQAMTTSPIPYDNETAEQDNSPEVAPKTESLSDQSTQSNRQNQLWRPRSFGNLPFSSSLVATGYGDNVQRQQRLNFEVGEHYLLPLLQVEDSSLGRVYTDFIELGRQTIEETGSADSVLEGACPNAEFFFRPRGEGDPITAYTFGFDVNRSFSGRFSYSLHLASSIMLGRLVRWMLNPTADTYALVPGIIRPTKLQRMVPHPAPLDISPFGALRDSLITNWTDFISSMWEAGIDISWPHTLNECFAFDVQTGKLHVSPLFAEHACNQENWKFGRKFAEAFPDLKDSLNFTEELLVEPHDRFW